MANYLGDSVPTEQARESLKADGVTNVQIDPDHTRWGISPAIEDVKAYLASVNGQLELRFQDIGYFQDWEFNDRMALLCRSLDFPIVGFDYGSLFSDDSAIRCRTLCCRL